MTLDFKSRYFYLMKCCIDILITIILLIVFFPLLLICGLAIKLDSPGPVIYKQKRVGKRGKVFNFYKFRTMHQNCDQKIHMQHINKLVNGKKTLAGFKKSKGKSYKLINDKRVTRIGKFLRKTSIDELPQLLNVLKGEMSLVGPRPHPLYEVELYNQWKRYRLDIKPGITGLGQVSGRSDKEYQDVYRLDLRYIKSATLLLDLKILYKTIFVVLSFKGAN
jgi:lipopolysaccharide/colanic/teichoic acid biosynthesis glycosyltransferase